MSGDLELQCRECSDGEQFFILGGIERKERYYQFFFNIVRKIYVFFYVFFIWSIFLESGLGRSFILKLKGYWFVLKGVDII